MTILTAILIYIATGFFLYYTALWLFKTILPLQDKKLSWSKKGLVYTGFFIGYAEDILFNVLYATIIHYILDRLSGYSHKEATFISEWTLSERVQIVIDKGHERSLSWAEAFRIAIILNKYDPGHIKFGER